MENIVSPEPIDQNAEQQQPPLAEDAIRGRVLVVDDEPAVRRGICRALRLEGYVVTEARSGDEAFEILTNGRLLPDVMVLDLVLPNETGLAFLARLPQPLPLAVILVSGQGKIPHAVEALRLGASDFLEKPVGIDELRPAVERAVASRRSQQERSWEETVSNAVAPALPAPTSARLRKGSYQSLIDDSERHVLRSTLDLCQGNVAAAARMLHLDRGNLFRRLKRLGMR